MIDYESDEVQADIGRLRSAPEQESKAREVDEILSDREISLLVEAALSVLADDKGFFTVSYQGSTLRFHKHADERSFFQRFRKVYSPTMLGQILLNENYAARNYQHDSDEQLKPRAFKLERVAFCSRRVIIDIIKACEAYASRTRAPHDYQEQVAYCINQQLYRRAISALTGYPRKLKWHDDHLHEMVFAFHLLEFTLPEFCSKERSHFIDDTGQILQDAIRPETASKGEGEAYRFLPSAIKTTPEIYSKWFALRLFAHCENYEQLFSERKLQRSKVAERLVAKIRQDAFSRFRMG